jgi:DNA repair photolyase
MYGMRWDHLRDGAGGQGELFGLDRVGVRTFDTPGFRGMTFYEVRARSAINRVPGNSRMSFDWTINPYRGCSHACVYCLDGQTPILLADGRTRPLAELRVGDEVYGTTVVGRYRRYTATRVLAHWRTVKPAYRVTLEDGTELVASGDHRFLTHRGWKHVTGTQQGIGRRPHLTTNDQLIGTGGFSSAPPKNQDYKLGYLCGLLRGDARGYPWSAPDVAGRSVRVAVVDLEALSRSRKYLAAVGAPTAELEFAEAVGQRRPVHAIRAQSAAGVNAMRALGAFPGQPGPGWQAGFLAGIFDAEGSNQVNGALRIANTDPEIIDHITAALDARDFRYVVENARRARPVRYVRLLGGLREKLRLLHQVDPAVSRKRTIDGLALKSDARLRVMSVRAEPGERALYDITTGTGDFIADGVVAHNCFARNTHTYLDLDAGHDFDTRVVVKINTPELVRAELARPKWRTAHIAMGTNVDPYQRVEGRYKLMPGVIEALRDAANPFSILTKGALVLRDLPLLEQAAERTDVGVNVSVGSVDLDLWRSVEPGTPSPRTRLQVCAELSAAGLGCGVLMAPILPYLSDSPAQLDATVRAIAESGARRVTPIVLHLRPGAREWYLAWLERTHPELVARYHRLYRGGSYAPKAYQQRIGELVRELATRYGMNRHAPTPAGRLPAGAEAAAPGPPVPLAVPGVAEQPTLL